MFSTFLEWILCITLQFLISRCHHQKWIQFLSTISSHQTNLSQQPYIPEYDSLACATVPNWVAQDMAPNQALKVLPTHKLESISDDLEKLIDN